MAIAIVLLPCTSTAQTLSPEETAFLKSLSGTWSDSQDYRDETFVNLYYTMYPKDDF